MKFKRDVETPRSQTAARTDLRPLWRVLRCVALTIVPEAAALNQEAWAAFQRLIEVALSDRPPALQRQFRLFLRFIQWLPLVRYGRMFTSLEPAQRARFLSCLEGHSLRLIRVGFWGLRTLILLGYYGRPEAARTIGYAADPRGWEALR